MRVLFTCSSGGHLAQLAQLEEWWSAHQRHWVTVDSPEARRTLADEPVTWAHPATRRRLPSVLRNAALARWLLTDFRPDVVVSTGDALALPFIWVARALGIPTIYLEVFERIDGRSVAGRLCRPVSDLFLVQWPEQQALYPDAELLGTVW